jgi:hypothetical protein
MNKILELYAYEAGLLCDGVPDSWDEDALTRYSQLLVNHCCDILLEQKKDEQTQSAVQYIREVFDISTPVARALSVKDQKTKNAIDTILLSMLGSKEQVSRWWCSPNKAFNGEIASIMFKKDTQRVVDYVLQQYSR